LDVAAAIALGLVLLVAGASKLAQPHWRADALAFGAPRWLVPVLPWLEVASGACLLSGFLRSAAALLAILLLSGFTVALGAQLARGHRPPCACFGAPAVRRPIGPLSIVRNVALIALGLIVLVA
jgi:uncharacterized membrane protein YphA (DoxX/SURF4 family)